MHVLCYCKFRHIVTAKSAVTTYKVCSNNLYIFAVTSYPSEIMLLPNHSNKVWLLQVHNWFVHKSSYGDLVRSARHEPWDHGFKSWIHQFIFNFSKKERRRERKKRGESEGGVMGGRRGTGFIVSKNALPFLSYKDVLLLMYQYCLPRHKNFNEYNYASSEAVSTKAIISFISLYLLFIWSLLNIPELQFAGLTAGFIF